MYYKLYIYIQQNWQKAIFPNGRKHPFKGKRQLSITFRACPGRGRAEVFLPHRVLSLDLGLARLCTHTVEKEAVFTGWAGCVEP